ncbi:MAG TPA: cytochrome c [Candidatus Binataceae bacterium]|nr:cytochrome c [Candidatus Binataceae bacterium]
MPNYSWWRQERARRQAGINQYVALHHREFLSFKNAPLAIKQDTLNFVGVQMILFRLFPVIFPEIWGPPAAQMAKIGLGPDPFDPKSVMPLGAGYHLSNGFTIPGTSKTVQVNYETLTCMGCHSGGVTTPNGKLIRLIGAPSPIGDYSGTINKTVNDSRYTAANVVAALNKEPLGWVYGKRSELAQEKLERALYNAPGGAQFFLDELKFISNKAVARLDETLLPYTYNVPNSPPFTGPNTIPGQIDVFSFAGASLANPDVLTPAEMAAAMPAAPAPSDVMTAWMGSDRPAFQWDDSVVNISMRETAASLTFVSGEPDAVNQPNLGLSGTFSMRLPSAPYLFDIDASKARRGAILFKQACQQCHAPGNSNLMPPDEASTDPNRADVFTSFIITGLTAEMRAGCLIPSCFGPGGVQLPDSDVLNPTYSYASIPLAGIWASAPYLHNGSVPTLYHLIAGDRPPQFYRGNTTYDQDKVGFTWDRATSPRAVLYDTTQDGHSNTGHTGPVFDGGIDWKNDPGKLADLLEFLKTQ